MVFQGFDIGIPNQFCSNKQNTLLCKNNTNELPVNYLFDSFVLLKYCGLKATYKQNIVFIVNIPGKTDEWIDCKTTTQMAPAETKTLHMIQTGPTTYVQNYLSSETLFPMKAPSFSSTLIICDLYSISKQYKSRPLFHMASCSGIAKTNVPLVVLLFHVTPWKQVQVAKLHHSLSFVLFADSNSTLSLLLHPDNVADSNLTNLVVSDCKLNSSLRETFKHCYSLSCTAKNSNDSRNHFIFLGHQFTHLKRSSHFNSWHEAYSICRNVEGHLPSIYSQTDLTDILKVVDNMFPLVIVEALYLGLIAGGKVCLTHFSPFSHMHIIRNYPIANFAQLPTKVRDNMIFRVDITKHRSIIAWPFMGSSFTILFSGRTHMDSWWTYSSSNV